MIVNTLRAIMGASVENWSAPAMPYIYPVDHGKPAGVRKAKRAAQKRRNIRARGKK